MRLYGKKTGEMGGVEHIQALSRMGGEEARGKNGLWPRNESPLVTHNRRRHVWAMCVPRPAALLGIFRGVDHLIIRFSATSASCVSIALLSNKSKK